MNFWIIANILSFGSACFTVASSWTKDGHKTYYYQVWQCLFYAAASYFFGVYAGILMMIINAFRNYLVASEKYNKKWMLTCSLLSLVLGLVINKNSIPGYITVLMTVYYTVSSFYLKGDKAVKINVAIDLTMWFIYDLIVKDIPSGIVDLISIILAIVTLCRILRTEKKEKAQR